MQIFKRDIHLPEALNVAVKDLPDYPPRVAVYAHPTSTNPSIPDIHVTGLDEDQLFSLTNLRKQKCWYFSVSAIIIVQGLYPHHHHLV